MSENKVLLDYRGTLDEKSTGEGAVETWQNEILLTELKAAFAEIGKSNPGHDLGVQVIVTDYGLKR